MSDAQREWSPSGSTDRPIIFTPRRSNSGLMLDKSLIAEIKRVSTAQGVSMRAWGHRVLWAAVNDYDAEWAEVATQVAAAKQQQTPVEVEEVEEAEEEDQEALAQAVEALGPDDKLAALRRAAQETAE